MSEKALKGTPLGEPGLISPSSKPFGDTGQFCVSKAQCTVLRTSTKTGEEGGWDKQPDRGEPRDQLPLALPGSDDPPPPPLGNREPRPRRARLTFTGADQKIAVRRDAAEGQVHHGPRVAGASERRLPHGHGGGERGDAKRGPRVSFSSARRGAPHSHRGRLGSPRDSRPPREGGRGRKGRGEGSAAEPACRQPPSTPVAAGSDGATTRRVLRK